MSGCRHARRRKSPRVWSQANVSWSAVLRDRAPQRRRTAGRALATMRLELTGGRSYERRDSGFLAHRGTWAILQRCHERCDPGIFLPVAAHARFSNRAAVMNNVILDLTSIEKHYRNGDTVVRAL